jgi:electron transfer flavoprotein alpha subunit
VTSLCLVELEGTAIADASLRALTLARGMSRRSLAAVAFGEPDGMDIGALASYGVSDLHVVGPQVPGYSPTAWARSLAGLTAASGVEAVIATATDRGSEVMAHLGALTGLPLAASCVAAGRDGDGNWRLTRQRWAGLLLEDAVLAASPALITVAPGEVTAEPADQPASLSVHVHEPALADGDLVARITEPAEAADGVPLATARVVVGGGRGVGGPDGFAPLEELAGLLGGALGVSRVATSQGWRPHRQQVGQTGTRIAPELYLACGISGAIQHMAGCQSAKRIVAINTDPGAPIMARADYAVIGDLHEIIPALIAAVRARLRNIG